MSDSGIWRAAAEYWYGEWRKLQLPHVSEVPYPTKGALDAWLIRFIESQQQEEGVL